jgi:hypothetical protein
MVLDPFFICFDLYWDCHIVLSLVQTRFCVLDLAS